MSLVRFRFWALKEETLIIVTFVAIIGVFVFVRFFLLLHLVLLSQKCTESEVNLWKNYNVEEV